MKHRIDPTVDCVFKALLGSEENKNLLCHFLNAVLSPPPGEEIVAVEIKDPFNLREFVGDKLTIVDVKATDTRGRIFQVEVQLSIFKALPQRMLFTWADIITHQLEEGQDYDVLKPVSAIWILGGVLFPTSPRFAHRFEMRDEESSLRLSPGAIHTLELAKWGKPKVETELDRWTFFFREGKLLDVDDPPPNLQTPEMLQAMATLKTFSEKEQAYERYRARVEYQRTQRSIQKDLDESLEQAKLLREMTETLEAQTETLQAQTETLEGEKDALLGEKATLSAALGKEREARLRLEEAQQRLAAEKEVAERERESLRREMRRLQAQLKG